MPGLFEHKTGMLEAPGPTFGVGFRGRSLRDYDSDVLRAIIFPAWKQRAAQRQSDQDYEQWKATFGIGGEDEYWSDLVRKGGAAGKALWDQHLDADQRAWINIRDQRKAESKKRTDAAKAEAQAAEAAAKAAAQQKVREQIEGSGAAAPGLLMGGLAADAPGAKKDTMNVGWMLPGMGGADVQVPTGAVQPRIWSKEDLDTYIKAGGRRENVPDVMTADEFSAAQAKQRGILEKAKREREKVEADKNKALDEEGRKNAVLSVIGRQSGPQSADLLDAQDRLAAGEDPKKILNDWMKRQGELRKDSAEINQKVYDEAKKSQQNLSNLRRKVKVLEAVPESPGSEFKPNPKYTKWKRDLEAAKAELADAQKEHTDNWGDWDRKDPRQGGKPSGAAPAPSSGPSGPFSPGPAGAGPTGGFMAPGVEAKGSVKLGVPTESFPSGPFSPGPPDAMNLSGQQLREMSKKSDDDLEKMPDAERERIMQYLAGEAKSKEPFKEVIDHAAMLPPEQGALAVMHLLKIANTHGLDVPEMQMKTVNAIMAKLKLQNPALARALVQQFMYRQEDPKDAEAVQARKDARAVERVKAAQEAPDKSPGDDGGVQGWLSDALSGWAGAAGDIGIDLLGGAMEGVGETPANNLNVRAKMQREADELPREIAAMERSMRSSRPGDVDRYRVAIEKARKRLEEVQKALRGVR